MGVVSSRGPNFSTFDSSGKMLFHQFEEKDKEFDALFVNHFWYKVCVQCDVVISHHEVGEITTLEQKKALLKLIDEYQADGCDFEMLKVLKEFAEAALESGEEIEFCF